MFSRAWVCKPDDASLEKLDVIFRNTSGRISNTCKRCDTMFMAVFYIFSDRLTTLLAGETLKNVANLSVMLRTVAVSEESVSKYRHNLHLQSSCPPWRVFGPWSVLWHWGLLVVSSLTYIIIMSWSTMEFFSASLLFLMTDIARPFIDLLCGRWWWIVLLSVLLFIHLYRQPQCGV